MLGKSANVGNGTVEKGVGSIHGRRPIRDTTAENINPPTPIVKPRHPSFLLMKNAKHAKIMDQKMKFAKAYVNWTSANAFTVLVITLEHLRLVFNRAVKNSLTSLSYCS